MKRAGGLALAAVLALTLAGCVPHQLQCASQYYTEYRGIGFLTGDYNLSFEASDDCSVLVGVPAKELRRLSEIAEQFPDKVIKPVQMQITGRLTLRHEERGWRRVFEATSIEKIDPNVSAQDAARASIIAFGTSETP